MTTRIKSVDGKIVPLSTEEENQFKIDKENYEKDFRRIRDERNRLLQETDWIVIREREQNGSVHNFEAFMKYRQELRDIPTKYNKVSLVQWPTKPEIDLG
tara:strand:+ start:2917 stop:3216 length:300 start_codon:yes stop_codon:yes gene_type:complete